MGGIYSNSYTKGREAIRKEICSRCKLDINLPEVAGGCNCCKSHPIWLFNDDAICIDDDEVGIYDIAKYKQDHK